MKTGIFCVAAGAAVAMAIPMEPHGRHHRHARRDDVVVTETNIVTATAPNVMVYVDQYGNPKSTVTQGYTVQTHAGWQHHGPPHHGPSSYGGSSSVSAAEETSSVAPPATSTYEAPSSSSTSTEAPAPTTYEETSSTAAPAPTSYSAPSSSSEAPAPSSSSSSGSGSGSGYGIVYSPYNSDNSCKSADQVKSDFENIDASYGLVRIYGTDCDQVATVLPAATAKGMKLFAGIYDITQLDSELSILIDAAKGKWDSIHTVSVGNEGVQMGTYTVSAVVDAVNTVRSKLRGEGYNGNVVTVDTSGMLIAYPELCKASDFAAANCHAFFNSDLDASGAGGYVLSQAQQVSEACGGKETWITESGWPWQGSANGKAVPSPENQSTAISSLKQSFSSNIILFTAFNDLWKTDNSGTFGAEKYWGIYGNSD